MHEARASTFFPFHDTLVLQKGLIHKWNNYWCIMNQCIASHLLNHWNTKKNLLFVFWIFLLASHANHGSRCERLFWTLSMYSTTLSMVVISMGSDLVSGRRVYDIWFLTWRNFIREKLLYIFKLFPSGCRNAIIPYFHLTKEHQCQKDIHWGPETYFLHDCMCSQMHNMLFFSPLSGG